MVPNKGIERKEAVIRYLSSLVEDREFMMGVLQLCLTTKCQLDCQYCKVRKLPEKDMSFSTLTRSIDFLAASSLEFIAVQFFGGEPLLRWDLVKKGTLYFKEKTEKLKKLKKIALSTNGILLDREKIDFFKKFRANLDIVFSFDGVFSQNVNRFPRKKELAGTYFDLILSNMRDLIKAKINFFVNMVVAPHNLNEFEKNVEYLVEAGIKSIRISYALGFFWTGKVIRDFFELVRKVYRKYQRQKFFIDISHCRDEPVLTCSTLTLMPDENLFVGTTYSLLEFFPHIKDVNHYGKLSDYQNFSQIKRNSRREVEKSLRTLSRKDDREFFLFANNIYLGILYERLFKKLGRE